MTELLIKITEKEDRIQTEYQVGVSENSSSLERQETTRLLEILKRDVAHKGGRGLFLDLDSSFGDGQAG